MMFNLINNLLHNFNKILKTKFKNQIKQMKKLIILNFHKEIINKL